MRISAGAGVLLSVLALAGPSGPAWAGDGRADAGSHAPGEPQLTELVWREPAPGPSWQAPPGAGPWRPRSSWYRPYWREPGRSQYPYGGGLSRADRHALAMEAERRYRSWRWAEQRLREAEWGWSARGAGRPLSSRGYSYGWPAR